MQHLFFQITITLNPIIIHKLWEKIFNQSWWEIKVRRPRHGNDSIFAHTLQRPPWGPGPGDRIQKADILPLLSVTTSDQVVWPPSQCGGKWRLSLRWVRVSSPEPDTEPEPELGRHQAPAPDQRHGDAGPVQPGHLTNTLHQTLNHFQSKARLFFSLSLKWVLSFQFWIFL